MTLDNSNTCKVCGRTFFTDEGRFPVGTPTRHHLIPKQKYRGRQQDAAVILICSFCHKQINKLFTNYELKQMTLSHLKKQSKVRKFVKWVRKE